MAHKYRAKPVTIDGIWFASSKEARRWSELKIMERAGIISELERQPRYRIEVRGTPVTTYVADARYYEHGKQIVEDCKGFLTDVYKIKRALMKAVFDIDIREV